MFVHSRGAQGLGIAARALEAKGRRVPSAVTRAQPHLSSRPPEPWGVFKPTRVLRMRSSTSVERMHFDDPLSGRVGNAVKIAALSHHTRGHCRSDHAVSVPTILPHHFRRRTKFGNGPRHRVCDSYERRATGWTCPEATWIPISASGTDLSAIDFAGARRSEIRIPLGSRSVD
jgi:hypothetical protein